MDTVGVGSHQQVLIEMIKRTNGPILELGAGDYSTPLIDGAAFGRKIVTIDNSKMWLSRYWKLESKTHIFLLKNEEEVKQYYLEDVENWSIVFVDGITWNVRVPAIQKYKNTSDYVIVHDTGYSAKIGVFGKEIKPMTEFDPGLRDFSDVFKYWKEYLLIDWTKDDPPTVLGSNFFNLDDIVVKKMIEINSNK